MSTTVQKHIGNIDPHLYHHGLIKILIEDQLKKNKDTWEQFLMRNYFQEPSEAPESSTLKTPRRNRRKEKSAVVQDSPITKTQEVGQKEKKKRTKDRKQRKVKGKRNIEEVHQSPEPSIEEDYQPLSERLKHLQKQAATTKEKKKGKQSIGEGSTSPPYLRRSTRLKGRGSKTQVKRPNFIDLGEETPEKPPAGHSPPRPQPSIEISPPNIDESPSRLELESSPPPPQDFEVSPRRTPEVDPSQQEVYDYLESLEKTSAGLSTTLPHMTPDAQVQSLKQEVFELEVLNKHIKQENEALKEQSKVDKIIHDNTMLHLGLWQKKNKKLKKKCRKLSRELINLKFRCLIRKPRMVVAVRKKKRGLDVLAEASEHMD